VLRGLREKKDVVEEEPGMDVKKNKISLRLDGRRKVLALVEFLIVEYRSVRWKNNIYETSQKRCQEKKNSQLGGG